MRYRVLGTLAPTSASAQQRLLLCCLLAHANRFVTSDALIEELWGQALPADPGAALRTQIARLRRRLPTGVLVTEPGGYRLNVAAEDLDSAVFEHLVGQEELESALALWRGGAFEEFADRPLVQGEATRLERLHLAAQERQARLLMARGEAAAAVGVAEGLLADHPDRESARAVLMEALYRSGRQQAALETYQSWRRELDDEDGLDPLPELTRLQQSILRHDVASAVPVRPVDSFLGRDTEVSEIRALLPATRLLTLTGPGGVGKTRLAVEVSLAAAEEYADGICLCELGRVQQPDAVSRALAWALGLTEIHGSRLEDRLVEHLLGRRMLIVLDGCEHVLDAAAAITTEVVQRTDGVTLLATSRERLAVAGEHVRPVTTLGIDASVRLFRDRARAASAGLGGSDDQVAEVCARLDGLPLAIELAAARVGSLGVEQMAAALDDRFAVLADRRRSLAATLQLSYDLLPEEEKEALCRLATFAGNFDRQAAAALGVETSVLLRLADRSLVDGAGPYRLLDSVRDFAHEQLREHPALSNLAEQHANWALQLVTAAGHGLSTAEEPSWAGRLRLHIAELRAAYQWLLQHEAARAVTLVSGLRVWALWRGYAEVFEWADGVAAITADAAALATSATGSWMRGDLDVAAALARDAMPHRWAIESLAEVAFLNGDMQEAQRLYRQATTLARADEDGLQEIWCAASVILAAVYAGDDPADEPERLLARAESLGSPSGRAMAAFVVGEARRSTAPLLDATTLAESADSRFIAGLARAALASMQASADPVAALDHYALAIEQWRNTRAWPAYWVTIRTLIVLLSDLGAAEEAAVLFGANHNAALGAPAFGRDAALLQATAGQLDTELGTDNFARCQQQGAALGERESATYALAAIASLRSQLTTLVSDN